MGELGQLTVHQLTVREAADLLDVVKHGWQWHAIDVVMEQHEKYLPSPLIFAATGTTYDSFPCDIAPDDLPGLYSEVARLNPFASSAARTLLEKIRAALSSIDELKTQMEQAAQNSDAPPSN